MARLRAEGRNSSGGRAWPQVRGAHPLVAFERGCSGSSYNQTATPWILEAFGHCLTNAWLVSDHYLGMAIVWGASDLHPRDFWAVYGVDWVVSC